MASIGDEKNIRALFSELKFADEQTAPNFNAVWQRAQTRSLKPRRAFNLSFAVATALLICSLVSLAVWSRYSQPSAPATTYANVPATSDVFTARPNESRNAAGTDVSVKDDPSPIKRRVTKPIARRQGLEIAASVANSQLAKEAKAIENWQSPTADLLSSPSDGLFKSLPQLNENANELKSFLPNRENDKEK